MKDVVFVHTIPIGNRSPQQARQDMAQYMEVAKIKLTEANAINIFVPTKGEHPTVECIYPVPGMPMNIQQEMKFSKVREVISPSRGTSESAGIDFFIPSDFTQKLLEPGENVLIPSGIKVNVPKGYALIAFNKSGVATKKGLYVGACVVDEDYQGEVHIHMTNVGIKTVELLPGDKIVQFILLPVLYAKPIEVKIEDLYESTTERGTGGFGSTDKK